MLAGAEDPDGADGVADAVAVEVLGLPSRFEPAPQPSIAAVIRINKETNNNRCGKRNFNTALPAHGQQQQTEEALWVCLSRL